jgi:hypothetical protein
MAWFLPSYGRPEKLLALRDAPGGMPENVIVLVNADDPKRADYLTLSPWPVHFAPAGSRLCDVWREVFRLFPDEPCYGLMSDDCIPMTPGWHEEMVKAAGTRHFANPRGGPMWPAKMRTATCIGGDLVRAMGGLAPDGFVHSFVDDVWDLVGNTFRLIVPLPDVVIEHRHPIYGTAERDDTHSRASAAFEQDRERFDQWRRDGEWVAMAQRLSALTGMQLATVSGETHCVAFCIPSADATMIHKPFLRCLDATKRLLDLHGIRWIQCQKDGSSHVGKAREGVLWMAMKTDATHLFWLDDDMTWEPETFLALLASDHDFSAVVGMRKTTPPTPACNTLPGGAAVFDHRTKFLEVRDVGFAFVCLKREVITRLCEANPDLKYQTGDGSDQYALFLDLIDRDDVPEGERMGEDFSFCRRWRRIGGRIFVHAHAALGHWGAANYTGKLSDFFEYEPGKAPPIPVAAE